MDLLVAEVVQLFYTLLWPMIRISAFLLTAPFFSIQAVTVRIRVLLALLLTWMVYPLAEWPVIDPLTALGLQEIFMQIFIGVLLGTLLQVVSAALIVGGQAISASMGLSMANMVDPNMGNVPVIAQFLIICSTLIFLALGGHIIVISLLLESFQLMPIGEMFEAQPLMALIIQWSSMMFLGAVLLALPIMVLSTTDQYRFGCDHQGGASAQYLCGWFSRYDSCRYYPAIHVYEQHWFSYPVAVAGVV